MSAKLQIEDVKKHLQAHKTNLCCEDVRRTLEGLGFEVRDGSQGGHKIFVHAGLPSFKSGSFNCGHGKNPEIKPIYISKIVSVLKQYNDELEEFLGEKS